MDLFEFISQSELIIFDLDGVILDSNGAKLEIMREVLRPHDVAAADQFIEEFKANFGRSRREHFLSFYEIYLRHTTGFEAFFERAAARYAEVLRERYLSVSLPRAMSNLMVKDGLPEICVSHPTDIGIPIPIKGYEDQRIYVWFEMAAGYSSLTLDTEPAGSLKPRRQRGGLRGGLADRP